MLGEWSSFCGSLIGSTLAALIAIFVMNRTNNANKSIASRNERIEFTNNIMTITAEFCALVVQAYTEDNKKRSLELGRNQQVADIGLYNGPINNSELLISEIVKRIDVLIFKTEIMFDANEEFCNESISFTEMKKDSLSGIPQPIFDDRLYKFRKRIAGDIKDYIGK